MGNRKDKRKKKSKKKKKKIPWYLQEELMKEKEAKLKAEKEAEEARRRMEEEERRWNSLTPAEREKEEVQRASEAKREQWKQFYDKLAQEEERMRRIEEERLLINKRRQQEREARLQAINEGNLDYGNILIQKVFIIWQLAFSSCHVFLYLSSQVYFNVTYTIISLVQTLQQEMLLKRTNRRRKQRLPQNWLFQVLLLFDASQVVELQSSWRPLLL